MRYLIQLAIPLIVVIAIAVAAPPPEMTAEGLQRAIESFALTYLAFIGYGWPSLVSWKLRTPRV